MTSVSSAPEFSRFSLEILVGLVSCIYQIEAKEFLFLLYTFGLIWSKIHRNILKFRFIACVVIVCEIRHILY